MFSAALNPVFSLSLRPIWATEFGQDFVAATAENSVQGMSRFVGDSANPLVRCLMNPSLPNQFHWPLVLTGPTGTGKTTLALSIVARDFTEKQKTTASDQTSAQQPAVDSNNPPVYLTAQDFSRRYLSALDTDSVNEMRERLATSGGLIFDNFQDLAGKTATQYELVQLIDVCLSHSLPLVFTGNCSPGHCDSLIPALRSRLMGGLHIPMAAPGSDAMHVLIGDMAKIHELELADSTIDFLATRLNVTVPKLNLFFCDLKNRFCSKFELDQPVIDLELLHQLLGQTLDQETDIQLCPVAKTLISLVADEFQLQVTDLKSNSRKQTVVLARGISIYLIRSLLGTSFQKTGSLFGNRDHSTIMHAFRKIEALLNQSSAEQTNLKLIVKRVRLTITERFPFLMLSNLDNWSE